MQLLQWCLWNAFLDTLDDLGQASGIDSIWVFSFWCLAPLPIPAYVGNLYQPHWSIKLEFGEGPGAALLMDAPHKVLISFQPCLEWPVVCHSSDQGKITSGWLALESWQPHYFQSVIISMHSMWSSLEPRMIPTHTWSSLDTWSLECLGPWLLLRKVGLTHSQ